MMILVLSIILFILLFLTGKSRGIKSFATLYANILIIILYIFLMDKGMNAVLLALLLSVGASAFILFVLNGVNVKSKTAFLSVMIVIGITSAIAITVTSFANIQGFAEDKIEAVGGFNYDINYSMSQLMMGIFIVSITGTAVDTSVSVSSALYEVYENNRHLSRHELHVSGMNIGRDIMSTTINTLFFAILICIIGFFIWHRNASPGYVINYKSFAQSAIDLLICCISSILVIPITSYMTACRLTGKQQKTKTYVPKHRAGR